MLASWHSRSLRRKQANPNGNTLKSAAAGYGLDEMKTDIL
jgi:hypothetical protein